MEKLIDGIYIGLDIFVLVIEWTINHWLWFIGGLIWLAIIFILATNIGKMAKDN